MISFKNVWDLRSEDRCRGTSQSPLIGQAGLAHFYDVQLQLKLQKKTTSDSLGAPLRRHCMLIRWLRQSNKEEQGGASYAAGARLAACQFLFHQLGSPVFIIKISFLFSISIFSCFFLCFPVWDNGMTEVGLGFNVSCGRLIAAQLTSYLLLIICSDSSLQNLSHYWPTHLSTWPHTN